MPLGPNLIALGSGQVGPAGVGNKAALLDRARRSGLPVPDGFVLLAEAEGRLRAAPPFRRKVAVRSAFSAEDHPWESLAGLFLPRLWVDPQDARQLAEAILAVWQSADRRPGEFRRDILLLEMVEALYAGVAFTEHEYEDDACRWTRGTGERLVAGREPGEYIELAKLQVRDPLVEPAPAPGFALRLQILLRDVRRVFGQHDWEIEWADDGRNCWLLQIRPMVRALGRNETFSAGYLRSFLPEVPSRFTTSLIASCSRDLLAYYRRIDPGLPFERRLIEVFQGRPMVNLSLIADRLRVLGLPTRLLTERTGPMPGPSTPPNLRRMLRKWRSLLRLAVAGWGSLRLARRTARAISRRADHAPGSFRSAVDDLRWIHARYTVALLLLAGGLIPAMAVLRRFGLLNQWASRQSETAAGLYMALVELAQRHPRQEGEAFEADFDRLLETYGHRGPFELDIASPRLRTRADVLRAALKSAPVRVPQPHTRPIAAFMLGAVWLRAVRALESRHVLVDAAMRAFDRLRRTFMELSARVGLEAEDLWLLSIEEAARLDDGWLPSPTLLQERRRESQRLAASQPPAVVRRYDDLASSKAGAAPAAAAGRVTGIAIVPGRVEGQVWCAAHPGDLLPKGWDRGRTIVAVRDLDEGWTAVLLQAAGVVTETGGELSHAALFLRALGLPAVIQAQGASQVFTTGDRARLDAAAGTLSRLPD